MQKTNRRGNKVGKPRTGGKTGRPASPAKILTRKKANQILEDGGVSPLDVMVSNMRFFFETSEKLGRRIEKLLGTEGSDLDEVVNVLKKMTNARMQAQECAVDLAPYLHPKLASVTLKNDDEEDENGKKGGGVFKIEFVKAKK